MKSDGLMLVLRPSPGRGVGVFTIKNIKKGATLPLWPESDLKVRPTVAPMERRYSVLCTKKNRIGDEPLGWHGPEDFHRMSIGWYVNHSKKPNVAARGLFALRDIKKGEEIFIDYGKL